MPLSEAVGQLFPVVIMLYGNGVVAATVGVPLMVNVVPVTDDVSPVGRPVTVAPVAPPDKVYVISIIGVLIHKLCVSVAAAEVNAMA